MRKVHLLGQSFHLEMDRLRMSGLLSAPNGWHHAVGAAFIAAVDHIHPAADAAVAARGGDVFEDVMLLRSHDLLPAVHLRQQGLESVGMLRAHHQIKFGHPAQQGFPLLLGDAASHDQGEIGIVMLPSGLATQVAVNLLLGVVADGAGVVKNQIRIKFRGCRAVSH